MPTVMDVFAGFASSDEFAELASATIYAGSGNADDAVVRDRFLLVCTLASGWIVDASSYTRIHYDESATTFRTRAAASESGPLKNGA